MWKLTLLLCGAMFLALLIGGEDRGQLRPGLAQAAAERAANPTPEAPAFAPAPIFVTAADRAPKPAPTPKPEPAAPPVTQAVTQAVAEPLPQLDDLPEPSPIAQTVAEPAISFSVGPGVAEPEPALPVQPAAPAPESADPATPAGGQILYVSANSVNVRQDPSTEAPVLGKLAKGEPAAVMWEEGEDWLRIEALNSDLEGYVARRFLTPDQP